MQYRESAPAGGLAGYIKLFWSLEYDPAAGDMETVLPDGCPEIVFNLSDRFSRIHAEWDEVQPATVFAGQLSRSISICPTGRVRLFGVRFQPAGAYPLLRFPVRELNNEVLDIATCVGRDAAKLEEKINEAVGFEERIRVFEDFFLQRLASAANPAAVCSPAVRRIAETGGSISVAALAREIGSSERTLERAFREQVGISPKMLARIVRFQSFISLIQKAATPVSLDASLELGYYDQSHAIRDFQEFSGITPSEYFRTTHGLSDVLVGGAGYRL